MERIWAPWRVQYVQQADKEKRCFLCEALESEDDRQTLLLWRGETCFCMLNKWPYNNGHLLIAPKAHTADMADLGESEILDQMHMLEGCRKALKVVLHPHGFNIGLNLGRAAGAGLLDHMHWHVVPRWEGDSNFMPVVGATKVIPQSLDALWELLREIDHV